MLTALNLGKRGVMGIGAACTYLSDRIPSLTNMIPTFLREPKSIETESGEFLATGNTGWKESDVPTEYQDTLRNEAMLARLALPATAAKEALLLRDHSNEHTTMPSSSQVCARF